MKVLIRTELKNFLKKYKQKNNIKTIPLALEDYFVKKGEIKGRVAIWKEREESDRKIEKELAAKRKKQEDQDRKDREKGLENLKKQGELTESEKKAKAKKDQFNKEESDKADKNSQKIQEAKKIKSGAKEPDKSKK